MVVIKKDEHGVYAQIEGWICRPIEKTIFREGDKVRCSHPAGPYAHIRVGKRGTKKYIHELWNVKIVYWWHPSYNGKPHAEKMRELDIKNSLLTEEYYKEKFNE